MVFFTEKKREKETESEETVPDDPHVSVAADEVIVHKKVKSVDSAFHVFKENSFMHKIPVMFAEVCGV